VPVPVEVTKSARFLSVTVLVVISPLLLVSFIINVSLTFSSLNGKLGKEYIIAMCVL
jgi:hypothetical protein